MTTLLERDVEAALHRAEASLVPTSADWLLVAGMLAYAAVLALWAAWLEAWR